MRRENGWTDNDDKGHWYLTPKGTAHIHAIIEKEREKAEAMWKSDSDEDQSNFAA